MRILIDGRFYRQEAAGIGRYTRQLITNLLKIDPINQYILLLTPQDEKDCDLSKSNLKKVVVPITHYTIVEQLKLPKILNKLKPDLVHFTNFNHPIFYSGKFIVTIHDLTLLFYPGAKKRSFFDKFSYKIVVKNAIKNAFKIIAVTENTKNDLIRYFGANPKKIEVIYEAVENDFCQQVNLLEIEKLKEKYQISQPLILYVGQQRPHKNLVRLIKVFENLAQKMPLKLVLVGSSDLTNIELKKVIEKSFQKENIILPGFVPEKELPAWYKAATIFVLPSLYEGFGLPGLEAMACGLPVVSSNSSCLPEVFGKAVLYFDPENISELTKKIGHILSDLKLRSELIKRGYQQIKKYSWEKMAKETLRVYKKVL